jgi:hypothetical protein
MRSLGKYITKYLASFIGFVVLLGLINIGLFVYMFYGVVSRDYSDASPRTLLPQAAAAVTESGLTGEMTAVLQQNSIWAMLLDESGQVLWSLDLPPELPAEYTIQDVAVFSKGYLEDYPVFVWGTDNGLLVLGYPKDSYTKILSNYYSADALYRLPVFVTIILVVDLLLFFWRIPFQNVKSSPVQSRLSILSKPCRTAN